MALGEERFVGLAADFEGKLRMKNAILFIGRNMKEDVVNHRFVPLENYCNKSKHTSVGRTSRYPY